MVDVQEEVDEEIVTMIEFILEATSYTENDLLEKPEVEFFQILERTKRRQEERVQMLKQQNAKK